MKKITTTILLVAIALLSYSQKVITNDTLTVYSTGFNQIGNIIRYQTDSITADSTYIINSGIVYCPDFWTALDNNLVEQSDVGLTGRLITYNFGTALIWNYNLLNLDKSKWILKE